MIQHPVPYNETNYMMHQIKEILKIPITFVTQKYHHISNLSKINSSKRLPDYNPIL